MYVIISRITSLVKVGFSKDPSRARLDRVLGESPEKRLKELGRFFFRDPVRDEQKAKIALLDKLHLRREINTKDWFYRGRYSDRDNPQSNRKRNQKEESLMQHYESNKCIY